MLKSGALALLCLLTFGLAQAQQSPQTYNGRLDSLAQSKDYKISLNSGDAVLITANTQGGDSLDPVLTLYDANGVRVAENDDANISSHDSRLAFVAPADGIYRVNIHRFDNTTSGRYQLTITIGDTSVLDYNVPMSGPRQTLDTQHFRFHYTTEGSDAVTRQFLAAITQAFEDAWQIEINKLGWPAPPSDQLMGGNNLYDVYVVDLLGKGGDAYGYTSPELFVGDNPNSTLVEQSAAASYIAIDNDFHDITFDPGQTTVTVMRSTAMHEFHHAIQFGFDALEPASWLAEATSTWMETVAAGKQQDATGYVASAFQYPELCLGTTANDNSVMYGEWTFMQFITDEFGKDAVHELWNDIAFADGFDAVSQFFASHQTDIPHELARYRLKNLARDYKLAPMFKSTVWLENTITGAGTWEYTGKGIQNLGANYYAFAPPPGEYAIELSGDSSTLQLWAVGLARDGLEAISLGHGGVFDTTPYRHSYLMVFDPQYDNNVDSCTYRTYQIKVKPGHGSVAPVDSVWNSAHFQVPN